MDSRKAAALEIFSVAEDEQLVRVLDEFLADLATGVAVDAERLLAAHPDLAPRLRNCLAGLRLLGAAAPRETRAPQFSG